MSVYMPQNIKLSDNDFRKFSRLIHEKAGISLNESKKNLVQARLFKIIQDKNFDSFQSYYQHIIKDETGFEIGRMLDLITTNLTGFFREPSHFLFISNELIPELVDRVNQRRPPRIRIWSAGCSTGEEPYSIVMTLLNDLPNPGSWNIKILGTDLSTTALNAARKGIYKIEKTADIPMSILKRYFKKGKGEKAKGLVKIKDEVRHFVTFRSLNLKDSFFFKEPFDVIFCRNVLIYFDKRFQANLVKRFYNALARGGYLFVGHSESISWSQSAFKYIRPTIYKK